jgi:hypothetical protein
MYNGRKINIQKLPQISFPTHQESSILKTRRRRYDKKTLSAAYSEISLGQIASPE